MKRDTLLAVLCVALFLTTTTLLAVNIHLEKVINKQNEVIVLQQEYALNQQNTIAVLEEQLENEKMVSDTLYDLAVFNGVLQEAE